MNMTVTLVNKKAECEKSGQPWPRKAGGDLCHKPAQFTVIAADKGKEIELNLCQTHALDWVHTVMNILMPDAAKEA